MKRISLFLAALLAAAVPLVYFGGKWAAEKYLRKELAVGQGRLRLVEARWRWSLELSADSLIYSDSSLVAESGPVRISANLFRSLFRFSPSVDVRLDTVSLRLLPKAAAAAPEKKKPRPDALAFPDFGIPASVKIAAGSIRVADDSGSLASLTDIKAATRGSRAVTLEVGRARARQLDTLLLAVRASLDWEGDTALAKVEVARGPDRIHLDGRLPKADMLKGEVDLRVRLASSGPYMAVFGGPPALPTISDLDFRARASQGPGYRLHSTLTASLSGFDPAAPYRLGPQRVEFRLDFRDSAGEWSLASHGPRGEDIGLQGSMHATASDSLADPAWLARHLEGSLRGHLQGIRLAVGGRLVTADARVAAPRLGAEAAEAELVTGDGTRISADLRKGARGWSGAFSAEVVPGERWLRAFVDTNVDFRTLKAGGRVEANRVEAVTDVAGLRAYGVLADSVHLVHRYGPGGYELKPSYWHRRGVVWEMSGRVETAKPGKPMAFRLRHPDFGSLDFRMPRADLLEARIDGLAIDELPYRGLDTLAAHRPRLSADFTWDRKAMTGRADLAATGVYRKEQLSAKVKAHWDRQALELPDAVVSLGGASLRAGASLALRGKPFFALSKLERGDYRLVFLEADKFDLAKALRVASPDPILLSGTLDGRLSYSDSAGFGGVYRLRDLRPASTADLVAVQELTVQGRGDTLVIRAVTVSKQEPLLNDSASLALTGVLGEVQTLSVRVAAGKTLFLDFAGRMRSFRDLEGRFNLRGGVVLPGKSGELRNLKAGADLAMVFKTGLPGMKLRMDTLGGQYAVAGLDTQTFSAPLQVEGGRLSIPVLSLRGKSGELRGRVDYALAGTRLMTASLAGEGLVAQLGPGDRVQLRDLRVDLRSDSTLMTIQAEVGSGSVEHVKSPMRAAADFSRLSFQYRAPAGKPKAGVYGTRDLAFLKVDAILDSSNVRYRMRSFETLQNLFKRKPDKRPARKTASRPMQVQINVETAGTGNGIETDILRVNYVGNFSMRGTYPYALVQGRINSSRGQLGTKAQAYDINRFEVKWLNSTLEEGQIDMEARKKLARDCEGGTLDSCTVINRLGGRLSEMQFSYDTDCGGAYGSGADVAALVYSVRRGCYSSAFAGGGSGMSYQEQALGLLEPLASDYLSRAAGKLSGKWIAQAQITGLGALASDKGGNDSASQALALEVISKEFWRTRLRLRSYYRTQEVETSSPWAYRMAVEWRPPLFRYIRDPKWKRRVKNNVSVDASIYTDTTGTLQNSRQELGKRLGLNYTYDFWGNWWAQKQTARDLFKARPGTAETAPPRAAAAPDTLR